MAATFEEQERLGKDGLKNLRATLRMQDSDDEEEQRSPQKALTSPLSAAVQEGDVRKVMTCLEQGANPNINNGSCEPPLVQAFVAGDVDIAAALLLHAADPLQFSRSGEALTELVSDAAPKKLLGFFLGEAVDEQSKRCVLSSLDKFMRWRVARKIAEFEEQMKQRPDKHRRHTPLSSGSDRRQGKSDEKLKELQQMAERKARSANAPELGQPSAPALQQVARTPAAVIPSSGPALKAAPPVGVVARTPAAVVASSGPAQLTASQAAVPETSRSPLQAIPRETLSNTVLPPKATNAEVKGSNSGYPPTELDSEEPLVAAARCGDVDMVKQLLKAKADANVQDEIGETPLFEAAARGDINMIAALLLAKGDPTWRSQAQMQPRDLANSSSSPLVLLLDSPIWSGGKCSDQEAEEVADAISDKEIRERIWHMICHMQAHAKLVRQINALS